MALLCFGGGVAYHYLHSSIRTASADEIRRVVPADLLALPATNVAARGRYDRFLSACLDLNFLTSGPTAATNKSAVTADLLRREAVAKKALAVIGEGSLEAPAPLDEESEIGNNMLRTVSGLLTGEAEREGAAKHRQACAEAVSMGLRLGRVTLGMGGAVSGYMTAYLVDKAALQTAVECARNRWLSRNDLARITDEIPPLADNDPVLADAEREELQRELFRPRLGVATIGPELFKATDNDDVRLAQYGNFDAPQTARMLAKACAADIANDLRPWSRQDNRYSAEFEMMVANLPELPSDSEDGSARAYAPAIRALKYRIAMNQVPNSLGLSMFIRARPLGVALRRISIGLSCCHELARTLLATCAYRADHGGRSPSSLAELIKGNYLKSMPIDRFSGGALLYAAKLGMAYSVGQNLKDDGGVVSRDVSINDQDFAYLPTQPKRGIVIALSPPQPNAVGLVQLGKAPPPKR